MMSQQEQIDVLQGMLTSLIDLQAQKSGVQGESSYKDAHVNPKDLDLVGSGTGGAKGAGTASEQPAFGGNGACESSNNDVGT